MAAGTQDMMAGAEGDRGDAPAAPFTNKGIQCLGHGIVDQGNRRLLPAREDFAKHLDRGSPDKQGRGRDDSDPNAVFLQEVLFFSGEIIGDQGNLFLSILDQAIGEPRPSEAQFHFFFEGLEVLLKITDVSCKSSIHAVAEIPDLFGDQTRGLSFDPLEDSFPFDVVP